MSTRRVLKGAFVEAKTSRLLESAYGAADEEGETEAEEGKE